MKVTYVSAANPVSSYGMGADATVSGWLSALDERGLDVHVVCRGDDETTAEADGITVTTLPEVWPADGVARHVGRHDPDVVFAKGGWSSLALDAADEHGVPSVLYVAGPLDDRTAFERFSPTRFVANSLYSKQWVTSCWGRNPAVVRPYIDFDHYTAPDGPHDRITMVNPVEEKGGEIFRAVAEAMPDREFIAKAGWYGMRNDDMSWDTEQIKLIAATFTDVPDDFLESDDYDVHTPSEPSFDDLPNVEYATHRDILETYARSRVVLMPSQWTESYGRVPLEAMWNGVPVIASHRGGLTESTGGAGLLVDDYTDPEAWVTALERLDDPDVYDAFAAAGRERAERYRDRIDDEIDSLVAVLRDAVERGP